jgi:hypothetical protein
MNARRHRRTGRYTPRIDRSAVLHIAAVQAAAYGCRCSWELRTFQHRDGYTYAQVLHDDDCPAANRRGVALTWLAHE